MSHCKACDKVMSSKEMRWYEDIKEHEDLCSFCLAIALPHTRYVAGEPVQLELDFGDDDEYSISNDVPKVQQESGVVISNSVDGE